jgi:hypothetical protein
MRAFVACRLVDGGGECVFPHGTLREAADGMREGTDASPLVWGPRPAAQNRFRRVIEMSNDSP